MMIRILITMMIMITMNENIDKTIVIIV